MKLIKSKKTAYETEIVCNIIISQTQKQMGSGIENHHHRSFGHCRCLRHQRLFALRPTRGNMYFV